MLATNIHQTTSLTTSQQPIPDILLTPPNANARDILHSHCTRPSPCIVQHQRCTSHDDRGHRIATPLMSRRTDHDLADLRACPSAPCCRVRSLAMFTCRIVSSVLDAWRTVLDSDPLAESDEEFPDEHTRLDYSRSAVVLAWLFLTSYSQTNTSHLAFARSITHTS